MMIKFTHMESLFVEQVLEDLVDFFKQANENDDIDISDYEYESELNQALAIVKKANMYHEFSEVDLVENNNNNEDTPS